MSADGTVTEAQPHVRYVVVWDVPPAAECGASFRVKVGVKCASECRPDGWVIEIRDHDGTELVRSDLGAEPWTGTTALFYADVELRAPDVAGRYTWLARVPPAVGDPPHLEASATINVRAAVSPECLLKVVAIDRETQTPVKGVKVTAHPYRALTDEHGVAELRLPRGEYRVFVSGGDYFPFRHDAEVNGDLTIRAELDKDLGPSAAELWS